MHNLLKPLLLAWQPANLILTHNTRIQLPHKHSLNMQTYSFAPCCFFSKSRLTNEDLLNNSVINYYLCSKQMLNSVWRDKIPTAHLQAFRKMCYKWKWKNNVFLKRGFLLHTEFYLCFGKYKLRHRSPGKSFCRRGYKNENSPRKPERFIMTLMMCKVL